MTSIGRCSRAREEEFAVYRDIIRWQQVMYCIMGELGLCFVVNEGEALSSEVLLSIPYRSRFVSWSILRRFTCAMELIGGLQGML